MDQSKPNVVLLVDDEEMVVTSIKSFLTLETDYEVVSFTSPQEALDYVKGNKVDLVISDYLMPDMDGIEFLAQVKDDTARSHPSASDRIRRQRKRHQGHQRRRTVSIHRKALGERRPEAHHTQRSREEDTSQDASKRR